MACITSKPRLCLVWSFEVYSNSFDIHTSLEAAETRCLSYSRYCSHSSQFVFAHYCTTHQSTQQSNPADSPLASILNITYSFLIKIYFPVRCSLQVAERNILSMKIT